MALVAGLNRGDLIAGKYRVERVIGRGGMSVVLSALHVGLDEPVAIKLLLPEALDNPVVRARFQREARAAAKIKSEHVARVIDVGAISEDTPYIVMERLDGEDLGARLKREGPTDVASACRYVLQACEAVAEAHSIGIVHRDLKPDNLFLTKRRGGSEVIKVLDFGISKAMAPEQAAMTRTSTIIGSPLYMSPEQLRTPREVDHRTDIWTLGVVLYELTTGRPPFAARNLRELAFAIVGDPPTPMARVVGGIPAAFEAIVQRCLAKERGPRYQSIGALAQALSAFEPNQGAITIERTTALAPVSPEAISAEQTHTGTLRLKADNREVAVTPPPAEDSIQAPAAGFGGTSGTVIMTDEDDEDGDDHMQTVLIDPRREFDAEHDALMLVLSAQATDQPSEDRPPLPTAQHEAESRPAPPLTPSRRRSTLDDLPAAAAPPSPWNAPEPEAPLALARPISTPARQRALWLIAAIALVLLGASIAYITLALPSPPAAPDNPANTTPSS